MHITLEHHAACAGDALARRLQHQALGHQGLAVPAAGHGDFAARCQVCLSLAAADAHPGPADGRDPIRFSLDHPRELHLRLCGNGLQPRRRDRAPGQAHAAHPHPVADLQAFEQLPVVDHHRLPEQLQQTRHCVEPGNRPHGRVQQRDAGGRHLPALPAGLHCHQLPHRQLSGRHRLARVGHRRGVVEMHLHPIDADAREPGDHAHDAGTTQPPRVDARATQPGPPGHRTRAPDAAGIDAGAPQARADGDRAGASDAACPGVGRLRCRARIQQRCAIGADVLCQRRRLQPGKDGQQRDGARHAGSPDQATRAMSRRRPQARHPDRRVVHAASPLRPGAASGASSGTGVL